ncbi:MAG: hypothetical protein HZB15_03805 [Actinobacteria bacterium]|nr:hypothetical protein [Actinomycetota bacterium]
MDVELTPDESEAVRKALRSYLSDLRMEITDTDNPEYRRTLRDERATLEAAVAKLSGQPLTGESADTAAHTETAEADAGAGVPTLRVVRMWWTARS